MKNKITLVAGLISCLPFYTQAQQVNKQVVAEHFTNSYCSVCASRNPGFYTNLQNNPQVLHISYFPSAPYAACPFNQYNKDEQDARTNFYNVYGGTPRIAIQGNPISASENYSDPGIFDMAAGQMTSFAMRTELTREENILNLKIVVAKTDTSYINSLHLYAAIVEDTVVFASNNGEPLQQDVFRRSFTGENPIAITVPVNVGDSTVYTQSINLDPALNVSQIYAYGILSTDDRQIEQASRSARLMNMPTSLGNPPSKSGNYIAYPNPAAGKLYIEGDLSKITGIHIWSIDGRSMETSGPNKGEMNIQHLPAGVYYLKLETSEGAEIVRFYHHKS